MKAAEAAVLIVELTLQLHAARRERDAEALRADRAAAAYHDRGQRMRQVIDALYRLRRGRAQRSDHRRGVSA